MNLLDILYSECILLFDQSINGTTNVFKDIVLTSGTLSFGNKINNTGTLTLTAGSLMLESGTVYNFSGTSISRTTGVFDFRVTDAEIKFNNIKDNLFLNLFLA